MEHTDQNRRRAQADRILEMLREAKARGKGVRKQDLLFEFRFTQASARIHELEARGFVIRHHTEPGEKYVTFYLVREPAPTGQGTLPLCAASEGHD